MLISPSMPPEMVLASARLSSSTGAIHVSHCSTNVSSIAFHVVSANSASARRPLPASPLKSGNRKNKSGPSAPAAR